MLVTTEWTLGNNANSVHIYEISKLFELGEQAIDTGNYVYAYVTPNSNDKTIQIRTNNENLYVSAIAL